MRYMSRRTVIQSTLAAGAFAAAGIGYGLPRGLTAPGTRGVNKDASTPKGRKDLNLLILMVDQERSWDTLPSNLGMPNHHRVAEQGTLFANTIVTTPLCTPSRSVIWTGQHVQHTGIADNTNVPWVGKPLDPAIPTLGHMLRDAGFYTAYKGKWHLHDMPKDPAWEHAASRKDELEEFGFSDYGWGPELIDSQDGWRFDERIAVDAANWLAGKSKSLDRPWALTVSFVNPHDIMYFDATGEQAKTRIQNVFPGPVLGMPDDPLYRDTVAAELPWNFRNPDHNGQVPAQADYDLYMDYFYGALPHDNTAAWIDFSNYYYNCIRDVDRHLGTVLDALEESRQSDNTIVVLLSDHGEMGGVHGLRQKGPWMYRENINVPLVISHPDARTSRRNTGIVSTLDFAPTMLGLVGIDKNAVSERYTDMHGLDVSENLMDDTTDRSRNGMGALVTYSVSHHTDPEFSKAVFENKIAPNRFAAARNMFSVNFMPDFSTRGFMRGIVTDSYKFARYFSPRDHHRPETFADLQSRNDLELFDLKNDPGETTNLAAGDVPIDLVTNLNTRLNALTDAEVGLDDGRYMPGPTWFWRG